MAWSKSQLRFDCHVHDDADNDCDGDDGGDDDDGDDDHDRDHDDCKCAITINIIITIMCFLWGHTNHMCGFKATHTGVTSMKVGI